jgi:hypothetical protein
VAIDVQYLIYEWRDVEEMLSPSRAVFPDISRTDYELAELSLLSSRREFWEVFVCLMGYCQVHRTNPNEALLRIDFRLAWDLWRKTDEKCVHGEIPFLRYVYIEPGFRVSPLEKFLPALYVVRLALAGESIRSLPEVLEGLERCIKQGHHHNQEQLLNCLRSGKNNRGAANDPRVQQGREIPGESGGPEER